MDLARPLLAATAVALVAAAPAHAATVDLGGVAPPGAGASACANCSWVQVASAGGAPSYRVPPSGGVIVQWSVRGGPTVNAGDRVRLRAFRPGAPSGGYVLAAESRDELPAAGQTASYPARIRVEGGEALGLRVATSGSTAGVFDAPGGNVAGSWASDFATGQDAGAPAQADARRVNLAVRLESDADRDGLGDVTQDTDDDNDGLSDGREDELGTDPLKTDTDGDWVRDGADVCPLLGDPLQRDAELDGVGDACDLDDDNDGISDDGEKFLRTSTVDRDTDDDGLSDAVEDRLGTDAHRADTDRDGLQDGQEVGARLGVTHSRGRARGTDRRRFRPDRDRRSRTNPRRRDTDGDGLADGREDRNRNGRRDRGETDPQRRDTDGDAVPDRADRFPLDRRR